MALVVNRSDVFPVGTVVAAYTLTGAEEHAGFVRSGEPKGTKVQEATVDATGKLEYTALKEETPYVLWASVSGTDRYLQVRESAFTPYKDSPVFPLSFFGGTPGSSAAANTTAFARAIAAVPARGGVIELAAGQYKHEGVAAKERSCLTIRGQGGRSGGGGLGGSPALGVNEATTVLADVRGAGTARSIDMRKGTACKLEHVSAIVFNPLWPEKAPIWDLESHTVPGCLDVCVESTSENAAVKPIPAAWGVNLNGICNSGSFYDLMVKGCQYSLTGPTLAGEESVNHSFYNFTSYGHQAGAILNPFQDWTFFGGAIEEARNSAGALNGAAGVRTTFACKSLHFKGTWIGGDKVSAGETGVQIQWQGTDLRMEGGQLSNATTLIECIGPCDKITLDGTAVALATNLVKLTTGVERVDLKVTEIAGFAFPTNIYAGTSTALGWQAKASRAVATPFTPATKGDTEVLLTFKTKAEASLAEVLVNGVLVTEVGTASGANTLTALIRVPAGQTWEVKNKTGTLEGLTSSYRFV